MSEARFKVGDAKAREVLAALVPLAPYYARGELQRLLESLGPRGIEVVVKRAQRHHSDAQRGYYHMCVGILANHLGMSHDECHEQILIEWAGSETKEFMGREVQVPRARSSRLPTEAYSELIETMLRVAAWAGVVIPEPERVT